MYWCNGLLRSRTDRDTYGGVSLHRTASCWVLLDDPTLGHIAAWGFSYHTDYKVRSMKGVSYLRAPLAGEIRNLHRRGTRTDRDAHRALRLNLRTRCWSLLDNLPFGYRVTWGYVPPTKL